MKQWLIRRSVVAILPVASLVLGFGACSSETGAPEELTDTDAGASVQSDSATTVLESSAARERLTKLSQQFIRVPAQPKAELPARFPPGVIPPKPYPAREALAPSPVLKSGEASRFLRQGSRVRAEVSATVKEQARTPATVALPLTAAGFVRVQPDKSPFGIEFAAKAIAKDVALEVSDGTASYPGAAPGGGDMLLRVTAEGVEDFIVLKQKPAHDFVDYSVNVSEVPGLRLYDNTLEFLSADGDPHLRIRPPQVVDANGTIHPARLELLGCAADTKGEVPWNRPVTAPGASNCTVRVNWSGQKLVYPAIVDPIWTTAGNLATARYRGGAVRLSTGFVLTCGGIGDLGIPLTSCEQFNPAGGGGTGTWAASTSMGTARNDFHLLLLSPATTVLAVGGNGLSTSERYNGSTWTASTGDYSGGSFYPPTPALTSDGAYVVLVDYSGYPYRYNVSTNAWSPPGTQSPAASPYRQGNALVQIPGQNTVLRVGGYYGSTYLATAERYRPSTDSWTSPGNAASMTVPRGDASVAVLDGNRVMIFGGYTGAVYATTAEIYSATGNSWTFTNGQMPYGVQSYDRGVVAAFHGSGKLLTNANNYTFIYDPAAASGAWTQLSTYSASPVFYSMYGQSNVVSAGSKVLMVPVSTTGSYTPSVACRLFDFGEKGASCSASGECQSGLTCAVDASDGSGVCCDTACSNPCSSCKATNKASGAADGTCGPRKINQYVGDTACPYTDPTTCGTSGYYCDGAGSCAKWSNQTQCGPQSCLDGDSQSNARMCDGSGACSAQTTSDCTTGYQCNFGQCLTYCYNDTDYCSSSYFCQTWKTPFNSCQSKKNDGAACEFNSECKKGNCVDGVCCDTACTGLCQACTSALTGQTSGACKPITTGTDPQSDCVDNGVASCGQNGSCNGAGACQIYGSGTVCAAATCASATSRSNQDTCNGTGTCVENGTTNCSPGYACVAGACQTTCTSDTQCASTHYCETATSQCVVDKPQGSACARDAACTGNADCVDGVCCDSACSGTCRSCLKNHTGLASNGLCGDVLDDTDPSNECVTGALYPTSCTAPGLCNGQGACRPYAKLGVGCGPDSCTGSTLSKDECNGAGACKTSTTGCYPFKCNTANNVCRLACTVATQAQDCVEGSFCSNGTCVGQLPRGSACTDDGQCKSTHCANQNEGLLEGEDPDAGAGGANGAGGAASDPGADSPGVCCDTECDGTCFGCKASIKGYGSDGVCEAVKNNTDPANDCTADPSNPCGLDGQCSGGGACRNTPSGRSCGVTTCNGNSVVGESCNGSGDCIPKEGGTDCAPYICRDVAGAFQCTNPCAEDADCKDGYFCQDATCSKKLANGKACEINGVCNSGYCVDGLCCDASCNGQCEACAAPGSEGTCTPVQGEPQGLRAKCDFAGEECGGRCDGVNAAACKYTANGEACGATSCENGLATSAACNGQGACKQNPEEECSPYTCDETDKTCLTRCEVDEDCSQGYACDETAQRCLPSATAAVCSEDRLTSVGQNGNTPCKPFLCVPGSGSCAVSCAFTSDCSPDFVCEASTKTCLPAPPDTTPADEACACRAVGGRPNQNGLFALSLVVLGLVGLRRRQRKPPPSSRASSDSATPTP